MALSSKKSAKKSKLIFVCAAVCVVALACVVGCTGQNQKEEGVDWDAIVKANPTDPFVQSYESNNSALEISAHSNFATCEDCHKDDATIAAKVGTMTAVPESCESNVGTREFCLSCHSWDKIKNSTILKGEVSVYNKTGEYNVHDNHFGEVDCSTCHGMHETSTLVCLSCHYLEKPEGWDGFK